MADVKGFDLASMLQDVSKLDTGREQIEYIDIDRIDDDPNNFYQLSRVDELAANIELLGLQQPIRVRENPEQPGRVIIVSGHRRKAALQMLVDEGKDQFRDVPCIREREAGSAALQELRLIYANADTRTMTSAEISRQVERVEALLYQLKEEGMEFPGRMRDHVAEACKVSQSKLARLKVIREKLVAQWKAVYEADKLNESTAYALAQMEPEDQALLYSSHVYQDLKSYQFTEGYVRNCAKSLENLAAAICPENQLPCNHKERKRAHIADHTETYVMTTCGSCCATCYNLATCKDACPKLAEQVKALKDERRWRKQQERQAQEDRDRPTIESITRLWKRFGEARAAAGVTVEAYQKGMDLCYSKRDDEEFPRLEQGTAKISTTTALPYSYGFNQYDVDQLVKAADILGVSLDYLLCRTDDPQGGGQSAARTWRSGDDLPAPGQEAVAKIWLDGMKQPLKKFVKWNGKNWCFINTGGAIESKYLVWFPLPEGEA